MSAEFYPSSGNIVSSHSATVGGSKPLHRFISGQPKSIGIVVLVLGCSFVFVSVVVTPGTIHLWITPSLILGSLFIICGILYIVAAHNTTKKTVTISLAMTIVCLLAAFWSIIHLSSVIEHSDIFYRHFEYLEENSTAEDENLWSQHFAEMTVACEVIFVFYSCVGAIILIIMSCLAGAALRSTRSQAVVVMTAAAAEPPVE